MVFRALFMFFAVVAHVDLVVGQTGYQNEIAEWRKNHAAEVAGEEGWLTLAGLFWLKEGVNTVGPGRGYDIQLTENFNGDQYGSIVAKGNKATLRRKDGDVETSTELSTDENGNKPTKITIGSQTFYVINREGKLAVRLRDTNYKARKSFQGLHWFPVDAKYRVTARFIPSPKEMLIANVLGGNFKMKSPGLLNFTISGRRVSLRAVESDKGLFLIFKDLTSRSTSYGAGRFLYAEMPKNGKVVLDFNKAENPPCAYTTFATCPLPPAENRLRVSIPAGEKRYSH
jgi:uncharacterized protein